jgi:hypothetical protein
VLPKYSIVVVHTKIYYWQKRYARYHVFPYIDDAAINSVESDKYKQYWISLFPPHHSRHINGIVTSTYKHLSLSLCRASPTYPSFSPSRGGIHKPEMRNDFFQASLFKGISLYPGDRLTILAVAKNRFLRHYRYFADGFMNTTSVHTLIPIPYS